LIEKHLVGYHLKKTMNIDEIRTIFFFTASFDREETRGGSGT